MKLVITGVISGIGRYLVMKFYEEHKHHIIGIDLIPREEVPADVLPNLTEYIQCDLSDLGKTDETIQEIIHNNPELDLFIHNAGIKTFGRVIDLKMEAIIQTLHVNTLASILFAKRLFESYERITIIIMGSNAGLKAYPNTAVYSASKSAVNALTEGIKGELKATQKLYTICPSIIATEEYLKNNNIDVHYTRQPIDVMNVILRIIKGKEKRIIIPVITLRLKFVYFFHGIIKLFRRYLGRN